MKIHVMKAVDAGEGGNKYGKKVPWDLGSEAYYIYRIQRYQ